MAGNVHARNGQYRTALVGVRVLVLAALGLSGPSALRAADLVRNRGLVEMRSARAEEKEGEPRRELQADLVLSGKSFRRGEPIAATFRVRNASQKTLTVYNCGYFTNHKVLVWDQNGREVPLTKAGKLLRSTFDPHAPRRKNLPVTVKPGAVHSERMPRGLEELFDLSKPGEYQVQVIYEETQLDWKGRLESNKLPFSIRE